jgi:hypothetical protein
MTKKDETRRQPGSNAKKERHLNFSDLASGRQQLGGKLGVRFDFKAPPILSFIWSPYLPKPAEFKSRKFDGAYAKARGIFLTNLAGRIDGTTVCVEV